METLIDCLLDNLWNGTYPFQAQINRFYAYTYTINLLILVPLTMSASYFELYHWYTTWQRNNLWYNNKSTFEVLTSAVQPPITSASYIECGEILTCSSGSSWSGKGNLNILLPGPKMRKIAILWKKFAKDFLLDPSLCYSIFCLTLEKS